MNPKSLLILEDNEAHVEAIRRSFRACDISYDIRVAPSLREYCAEVDACLPDIALLDLNLPDGNAQEALSLLSPENPFPSLVMTSMGNEAVAVAAMRAGALDYMAKSPRAFAEMPVTLERALIEWGRIQKQKKAENELRNLRTAVEQSANTVVITDAAGAIEYVNPAFEKSSGYTAAEVLGKNPRILKSGEQSREFYRDLWSTITSGKIWSGQFHNRRRTGTLYWEAATISPVFDQSGKIARFIAVKENINDLKKLESDLRVALERAEEATLAKSEFLANMSHEIRTPLNGILGMTELLLDSGQTAEQHQYAEAIHSCGDSLLTLINDILDFSKVEAGQLTLESMDFDIRTSIEETIELLAVRAQECGIELVCIIDEEVPEVLNGDPGRLRQVLFNLIGNAIKFTSRGGVTLHVERKEETKSSVILRFRVTDTGIGIPADKLEAVFAKFTQGESSTARRYGGTGLGLSICRQLVHLFRGQIGVTSTVGKGSTFFFTARLDKPATSAPKKELRESDLHGVRVLVADDFKTNRDLITGLLKKWGCIAGEAPDGESALALMKEAAAEGRPYAAALIDMRMPGIDGQELGRRIKLENSLGDVRLIMLTSIGRRGDAERLTAVGFSGYLPKPVRPSTLRKCLALVLGREGPADPEQPLVTRHTVAESARRKLHILVAEDNSTNRIIAVKMLEKLGHRVEGVADGSEAVERLRRTPYDLVFMDCQMPVMDGFEAVRVIRQTDSGVMNPSIPIVALTAHAMKEDRDLCLGAGMNDYVSKPTSVGSLAAAITRCFPESARFGDAERTTAAREENEPRDFDRSGFWERTAGDSSLASEMIEAFLADSPEVLTGLSRAVGSADVDQAGRLAHSLKGSSANMGGEALSEIAAAMEKAASSGDIARLRELLPRALSSMPALHARLREFQSGSQE